MCTNMWLKNSQFTVPFQTTQWSSIDILCVKVLSALQEDAIL